MNRAGRFDTLRDGARARLAALRNYARTFSARPGASAIDWRTARGWKWRLFQATHGPSFDNNSGALPDSMLAGLRLVGYSDDILELRHRGYFADAFEDETYRGQVWQLPARDRAPVYLAGYIEANAEYAVLCARGAAFETYDDKRDAARAADYLAERNAERNREESERQSARDDLEQKIDDQVTELKEARELARDVTAVLRELKACENPHLLTLAHALRALRAARADMCEKIEALNNLRDERADLGEE